MITRFINNEEEYLNLVADVIEIGIHCSNPYSERDEDGLTVADRFNKFPIEELYDQLGVYPEDEPLPNTLLDSGSEENGMEWEEHSNHIHEWKSSYRNRLKVFQDNPTVITPEPKHYPIIISWHWADDWDRMGSIKERLFDWWSIKELKDIPKDSIRKTKELWETKFRALLDEQFAKEQERKRNETTRHN